MIASNDYCGLLVSTTTISYCFVPTLFSVSLSICSLVIVSLRMSYFAPRALLLIIKLIVSGSPGRLLDPLPSSFFDVRRAEPRSKMSISVQSAAQNSRFFGVH